MATLSTSLVSIIIILNFIFTVKTFKEINFNGEKIAILGCKTAPRVSS